MSEAAMVDGPGGARLAPRPDHIPHAAVYDFDLFADPALRDDAHARILDVVQHAPPVFWTPRNGGHWIFSSHKAVFEASRAPQDFTSEFVPFAQVKQREAALPPGAPHILMPVPINVDPPEHIKYRAPLNTAFSPRAVMALKEDIRAHCVQLIALVRDQGGCEFMSAIAEPLPVELFLRIFGLPVERRRIYRDLAREHLEGAVNPDPKQTQARMQNIVDIVRDTLLERRAAPRDDLISTLWQLQIDGAAMTLADMENFSVVLFLGGLDTVMNGMGHGIRHLALNPELQDKLRADPKLIPEAAEELLRRYTFTVPPRMVAHDLEFDGLRMKKGERVFLFLPGADLDASEFPQPERFDLRRENKAHIAFGTGPHRCVGSHLARVELQTMYEEFLARVPKFRLDPARKVTFHGGHVIGPDELHLVWDA